MTQQYLDQQPQKEVSAQSLFSSYKIKEATTKARNRKGELIDLFKDRINLERIGTPYKQLNFLSVRNKVSHLTTLDLEAFYQMCCASKSGFSKTFFGALKTRQ